MNLFILIVFSLLLRLLIAFVPSFGIDMGAWVAWSNRMATFGPWGFYSKEIWTNYLPGYLYVLWGFGLANQFFHSSLQFYEWTLKFPAIIADLATTFLIFKIVKNHYSQKRAFFVSALYALNPAIIFNSSVWGQVDSIFTFFLILSSYFLVEKERPVFSGIFYSVSLLIKPQAIAVLPILFFYIYRKFGWKIFAKVSGISALFVLLVSFPFFVTNPILGLPSLLIQMSVDYPYTSLFAFNFWWLIGGWKIDTIGGFILTPRSWGVLLFVLAQIFTLCGLARNRTQQAFYLAVAIILFSFFVLPTRVHERYLFPFFAFFAISSVFIGKFYLAIWVGLIVIHFLNLYYVYAYYNPNVLRIESLFTLTEHVSFFLALATVLIFGLFLGSIGRKWLKI